MLLEKLQGFKPEFSRSVEKVLDIIKTNREARELANPAQSEHWSNKNNVRLLETEINKAGKLLYLIAERKLLCIAVIFHGFYGEF